MQTSVGIGNNITCVVVSVGVPIPRAMGCTVGRYMHDRRYGVTPQ